jgi:hypothetical protein
MKLGLSITLAVATPQVKTLYIEKAGLIEWLGSLGIP